MKREERREAEHRSCGGPSYSMKREERSEAEHRSGERVVHRMTMKLAGVAGTTSSSMNVLVKAAKPYYGEPLLAVLLKPVTSLDVTTCHACAPSSVIQQQRRAGRARRAAVLVRGD